MEPISVKAAAILDARPEDVYSTLADYQNGHPHILPEGLYDLRVEQGGYGAGTVFRVKARAMGVVREFYMRVSEPEPGRVLMEQDIDSPQNTITTFTVTPVEDGKKSHVEISTVMHPTPGIQGFMERIFVPLMNVSYRKELTLLEAFAQKKRTVHA